MEVILDFTVTGQIISRTDRQKVVADSRNILKARFTFVGWDDVPNRTAAFTCLSPDVPPDPLPEGYVETTTPYNMVIDSTGMCLVPWEVIRYPGYTVSAFGGDLVTANVCSVDVLQSGYREGQVPPVPTPDIYNQLVSQVQAERTLAQQAAQDAEADRQEVAANTQTVAANTAIVEADKATVAADKQSAEQSAQAAQTSAGEAANSSTQSQQAFTDLLAMLGTQVATLTGGKLTPSQLPPLAINDTFPVANVSEIVALDAQRGDVAIVVSGDVVTDSYILAADDPTAMSNWKKLGVSYVAEAGHAVTADNAANADKIGGKRIVGMTQAQYNAAVIDPDTFYFVAG